MAALVGLVQLRDRRAVDLREPRANHRHELRRRHGTLREELADGRGLVGPDVDHEMIRRVLRQAGAPLMHQVVAHDSEQQQDHQAKAERDDLDDAVAAAARDVRHAVAPRDADAAAQRSKALDQHPTGGDQHDERCQRRHRHVAEKFRIAHEPVQQRAQRRDSGAVNHRVAQRRRFEIVPEHARRRHLAQLQERRQSETDQDEDRGHQAEPARTECRARQFSAHQIAQQKRNALLRRVPDQRAAHAGDDRDCQQLEHADGKHQPLRGAHALHQRDGIEVTRHVASRSDGYGNCRKQNRDERRQIQEPSGAIDSRADLRTRFLDVDDALPGSLARRQLLLELRDRRRCAREQRRIVDAAAFLRELRRRHILETHEQRRREIDELRALVGPVVEHFRDCQLGLADADAIADARIELAEQPRLQPRFARTWQGRDFVRRAERHVGDLQPPTQRIARGSGANRGERAVTAFEYHARKRRDFRGREPGSLRELEILALDGRARLQAQIRGEHLARLLIDRETDAAGEEADCSERGDGDQQCEHQHAQLARLAVAQECQQCEPQRLGHFAAPRLTRPVSPPRS